MKIDLGRAIPIYRKQYDDTVTYELNDVVLFTDGNLYWHTSVDKTTGVLPTDETVWTAAFYGSELFEAIQIYASQAQEDAAAAEQSKQGAEAAKQGAESAMSTSTQKAADAAGSATSAQQYAARAENAAIRQPYPNESTGTWFVWNTDAEQYVDTGISYGTNDHTKLTNRDAVDQHPIGAIIGLQDALDNKQPVGEYITEETDPTVPDWAKESTKPTYTASEVGARPDTWLPSKSDVGLSNVDNVQQYSADNPPPYPVTSVNGQTGDVSLTIPDAVDLDTTLTEAGKAADAKAVGDAISSLSKEIATIPSGKDGITPTIGDNGNWYLGDTDTGKPSRGETGPAGADGKDGAHGAAGADGHTPVKGSDYWTAEDQQSIVADVLAALPTWEGGSY